MKRLLKYLLVFLGVILVLLGAIFLLAETRWGKDRLRDLLVDVAGNNLAGQLRIGSLHGNLFSSLELRDILLTAEGDTVARLPLLSVRYRSAGLLTRKIQIEELRFDSLTAHLKELPDGRWNLATLVRERGPSPKDSSDALGGWEISIRDLSLNDGAILVRPLHQHPGLPRAIRNLNVHTALSISGAAQAAEIRELSFSASDPSLRVDRFSGSVSLAHGTLEARGILLQTLKNRLELEGSYSLAKAGKSRVDLKTSPLVASEFSAFLPGVEVPLSPAVELHVEKEGDSIAFVTVLREGEQQVSADGVLRLSKASPQYSINAAFERVDLAPWLREPRHLTDVSGKAHLEGTGLTPHDAAAQVTAELGPSVILTRTLDHATIRGTYHRDRIQVIADITGPYGNASFSGDLKDPFGAQRLSALLKLSEFDVAPLKLVRGLDSKLNLVALLEGREPGSERRQGTFALSIAPSGFRDIMIDTLFTKGRFAGSTLKIDTLHIRSNQADVDGEGELTTAMALDFRFRGVLKDARPLEPLIALDALAGDVVGKVSGRSDSLDIQAHLRLDTLSYLGFLAPSARGDLSVQLVHGQAFVAAGLELDKPSYPPLTVDSSRLQISYRDGPIDIDARLYAPKDIGGRIQAHIVRDTALTLTFPLVTLHVKDQEWSNGTDTARVVVKKGGYGIENVRLRHGPEMLVASGVLHSDSGSAFQAELENIDLSAIRVASDTAGLLNGIGDAKMTMNGGTRRPEIRGRLNIRDLEYLRHRIGNVSGDVTYADSALGWDATCVLAGGDTTDLEGRIPIAEFRATSGGASTDSRPAFVRVRSTRFGIAPLRAFAPELSTLKGTLSGDLTISRTTGGPEFSGTIRLDSAEVRSTALGIAYDSISAVLSGRHDSLCLGSLVVRSGEGGHLTASGNLVYQRGMRTLAEAPIHSEILARNFVVAKTRDYELKADGQLFFDRVSDSTSVRGAIDVQRCRVWLPAFLGQFRSSSKDASLPLLVAAGRRKDTLLAATPVEEKEDSLRSERGGLGGRVKLNIPRNTWIQSPEINVEISGSLDLVPRGSRVEVFGHINVERGSFNLYGKKFTFVNGRVEFEGGTDPNLLMEVKYSYRGPEKEQEEIRLYITGSASKPSLEFTKNNERISSANAVSYVMFGRSLDELSQDQKSTIAGSTNDLAQSMASSVLSNQLSSTVGKSLGLDVIEVDLQDNWRAAYLTAGKYVTEKLYVRYTKGFQQEESGEAMEEVALEYEPFRPFMFQLIQGTSKTTGFNIFLILK